MHSQWLVNQKSYTELKKIFSALQNTVSEEDIFDILYAFVDIRGQVFNETATKQSPTIHQHHLSEIKLS